jgi:hypothetical protein
MLLKPKPIRLVVDQDCEERDECGGREEERDEFGAFKAREKHRVLLW